MSAECLPCGLVACPDRRPPPPGGSSPGASPADLPAEAPLAEEARPEEEATDGVEAAPGVEAEGEPADAAEAIADRVLLFLRGQGPAGVEGRTLDRILNSWDNDQMERVHDFIQWLFPTDERSRAHPEAPVLTRRAVLEARSDPVIIKNVEKGLVKFLHFLGLEWVEIRGHARCVAKKRKGEGRFEDRVKVAWKVNCAEGNHNWKRVSRMLSCLRLLGMRRELEAVYSRLERLWARGRIPAAAAAATAHWRTCAGDPLRRPMPKYGSKLGVTHTWTKYATIAGCKAPQEVGEPSDRAISEVFDKLEDG